MMMNCDILRHSIFMLVSAVGILFTQFYDGMKKTLVDDFTIFPFKNRTFDGTSNSTVIKPFGPSNATNNSGLVLDNGFQAALCQSGYNGNSDHFISNTSLQFVEYNITVPVDDPRFQCMKVALDSNHSCIVCVDGKVRGLQQQWDQGQIEHIYSWMKSDPELGFIDLDGGNGFYALSAGALNRSTLVIGYEDMDLRRMHKGILLSGLQHLVTLLQVCQEKDNPECHSINNTNEGLAFDNLMTFSPSDKAVLRARLDQYTVDSLLLSRRLFTDICLPFMIFEIEKELYKEDIMVVSLVQLADMLISEFSFRPFTENGIALTLNNIMDWPEVVYFVASSNLDI